jgi:hypothetical protein
MFHFGAYCRGREDLLRKILQPRCHYRGGLPGQQLPGHAVLHLGDEDATGVHHQGLCAGWRTAENGKQVFGKDYFDELLERIREIRASE